MTNRHQNWGGARENCGRRAVYRGKAHSPWNVRLTHTAHARLNALRKYCDISVGDMIETLVWDLPVDGFEVRAKPPLGEHKKRQITFRLSIAADARLKQLMRVYQVSGGDATEALIMNVPATYVFPSKKRAA